ncbi:hypothetical protein JYU04_01415 [Dehalococcoides mccartyi]|nr:hypothetical protein [Dehalococcoides mccartyi]
MSHATGTATLTEITVTSAISRKVRPKTAAVFARQTISIHSDPAPTDLTSRYTTGISVANATAAADATKNAGGRLPLAVFHPDDMTPEIVTQTPPGFQKVVPAKTIPTYVNYTVGSTCESRTNLH